MQGKVVVVTGANAGIGKEAAKDLARQGAEVVLVCRSETKGKQAVDEIRCETGNERVSLMLADMSSQASIRAFADAFKKKYTKLDVLLNNAGLVNMERVTTVDGLEATFATNHLGYFLTTLLLLDLLKASEQGRIVNVSSGAHPQASKGLDFDDLQHEKKFSGFSVYAQTKLANIMFTYELARRLEGTSVTVNALHPGVIASNFGQNTRGLMKFFVNAAAPFMITPVKGAQTSIYLASSPEVAGVTGKYFASNRERKSSKASYDVAAQKRLWDLSEELTGMRSAARRAA
ncbi:MAG: SDR family oxidoreductase [Sandaracinaceae bacterium]|nr:SDR family oxidoreductase [Sandaracinaceae bacterium]